MSRLVHSDFMAYLRSMQASRHRLFAFVEGSRDPYFYGGVCAFASAGTGVSYQIATAAELPNGTGGKPGLLRFYRELRARRKLLHDFKGNRTGSIFFLDKDADDLLGSRIRSKHVVYTQCFDLEAHAFRDGSLKTSTAAAAFVEPEWLDVLLADAAAWRASAAERWKEWVQLCVFSTKRGIRCVCNFGNSSRVNKPLNLATDPVAYAAHLSTVEKLSGLSAVVFKTSFVQVAKIVDNIYARSHHDRIFSGKWYQLVLEADVLDTARARPRPMRLNNFGDRVLSTLFQSLRFEDPWADHFARPVKRIIGRL